jgi:glycosyltransferase involved in cell wall biosynthesis
MPTSTPAVTVVITSHNRKALLRRAVASALEQTVGPEVIVTDDASTDGTPDMLADDFPDVKVIRAPEPRGYIVARNVAAHEAQGDIIVSIDDDAEFQSPDTVAQTLADFDHPRVGAVAMPFVDLRRDESVRQMSPSTDGVHITSFFAGSAHALRRDVFMRLGCYASEFGQRGEEKDYSLRLLDRGFVTRAGRATPLLHRGVPLRSQAGPLYFDTRNDVWYLWRNVPMPYLLTSAVRMPVVTAVQARGARDALAVLRGLTRGWSGVAAGRTRRSPVRPGTYRLHRRIARRGTLRLDLIERRLPPIEEDTAAGLPAQAI